MAEAMKNYNAQARGLPDPFALYSSAFLDARQTLRHLCRNLEDGMAVNILQDKDQNEAICIRVRYVILSLVPFLNSGIVGLGHLQAQ